MLLVTKTAPNRVDVELSAVLDATIMSAGLDSLFLASQDISHGVMMYSIPSFSVPTGGAIAAEMMRLPQLFELIRNFDRCAVVTDIDWIRAAAEFEGKMIPGLAIKGFEAHDAQAAERWLADV